MATAPLANPGIKGLSIRKRLGRPPMILGDTDLEQIYKYCLLGVTNNKLAELLEVSPQTIDYWLKNRPEFLKVVKKGRAQADAEIASSLYRRGLGYTENITEDKVTKDGEIVSLQRDVHVPADTTAQIFWLKNRQRELWRDRQEQIHMGPDGGPIQTQEVRRTVVTVDGEFTDVTTAYKLDAAERRTRSQDAEIVYAPGVERSEI